MLTSNIPYVIRAYNDWILDNQCTPYLLVNTEDDAVCVPTEHIKNNQIVLNISPVASDGLLIDDDGVSFRARFSGVSREIYVPVASVLAVYARENGRGMAFSKGTCIEMNPAPITRQTGPSQAESSGSGKISGLKSDTVATGGNNKATEKDELSKKRKGKPSLTIVK